jgi:hypothetical protein
MTPIVFGKQPRVAPKLSPTRHQLIDSVLKCVAFPDKSQQRQIYVSKVQRVPKKEMGELRACSSLNAPRNGMRRTFWLGSVFLVAVLGVSAQKWRREKG